MKKLPPIALLSLLAAPCFAIDTSITESEIAFSNTNSDSISISISGPDGYNASHAFEGDSARLSASQINQGIDGSYNFDVIAITKLGAEYVEAENGRESGTKPSVQSEKATGHFRLDGGSFVLDAEEKN